jgi:hypothetical protein
MWPRQRRLAVHSNSPRHGDHIVEMSLGRLQQPQRTKRAGQRCGCSSADGVSSLAIRADSGSGIGSSVTKASTCRIHMSGQGHGKRRKDRTEPRLGCRRFMGRAANGRSEKSNAIDPGQRLGSFMIAMPTGTSNGVASRSWPTPVRSRSTASRLQLAGRWNQSSYNYEIGSR